MGKKKLQTKSRFFDLPFSAPSPPISNPEIGLAGAIRRGSEHSYTMNVTLLDAPDQRLIKAGIVLAHRVVDGRGEWYLDAPSWAPWLPVDEIEQMGDAELPQRFAELVLPFRRWATLGFMAALACERNEFVLRDRDRLPLAIIRDDKVSAARSGLTFARYREVTLHPINLNREQLGWLTEMVQHAGGSRLPALPHVLQRLGATRGGPRVGATPMEWDEFTDVETFVGGLIGSRHQQLLAADLMVRSGRLEKCDELCRVLRRLRSELSGLASVLDPIWLMDVDAELGWADAELSGSGLDGRRVLQGERYLRLLDRLVLATRAPEVGQAGANPAAEVLRAVVEQGVAAVHAIVAELSESGPARQWEQAAVLVAQLADSCELALLLLPDWAEPIRAKCQRLGELVAAGQNPGLDELGARYAQPDAAPPHHAAPDDTAPDQEVIVARAFADGRAYERRRTEQLAQRRDALAELPKRVRKLDKAVRS